MYNGVCTESLSVLVLPTLLSTGGNNLERIIWEIVLLWSWFPHVKKFEALRWSSRSSYKIFEGLHDIGKYCMMSTTNSYICDIKHANSFVGYFKPPRSWFWISPSKGLVVSDVDNGHKQVAQETLSWIVSTIITSNKRLWGRLYVLFQIIPNGFYQLYLI